MASPFRATLQAGRAGAKKLPARVLGGSAKTASTGAQGAAHAKMNMERGRNVGVSKLVGRGLGTKGYGPGGDTTHGANVSRKPLNPVSKPDQGQEKIKHLGDH